MKYEDYCYEPEVFTKILVSSTRFSRIVAFCRGDAVERLGLHGIERSLREFMADRGIRKATYGIVVNSCRISEAEIRDLVSNFTKGSLTCVWGIVINETARTFFACHTLFKVPSTPLFEDECRTCIKGGFIGVGERKKYGPFFEWIMIKLNPVIALSVYAPQKSIARISRAELAQ